MSKLAGGSVWGSRLCWTAVTLFAIGILIILVTGPGHRFGILGVQTSLLGYMAAVLLMVVAMVAGIAGLGMTSGSAGSASAALTWLAVIVAVAMTWNNFNWFQKARAAPPIHDITTDTVNPPEFVDVLPLRADAPNPPEYGGEEISTKQREAYPDLVTIESSASAADAYEAALLTVESLGWDLAGSDAGSGRVEATDTTFWFGFKDDVVVRIRGAGSGSRIDVRSKSRVGLGDVGTNAARIRTFRETLLDQIG
jgi:hypothetical protein